MKVLITGRTGLIGLRVAEMLLANGASVTLFDRATTNDRVKTLRDLR